MASHPINSVTVTTIEVTSTEVIETVGESEGSSEGTAIHLCRTSIAVTDNHTGATRTIVHTRTIEEDQNPDNDNHAENGAFEIS
jgi:hypothetical protein